jgi:uncharacterized protein YbjT (DUF2867 family)
LDRTRRRATARDILTVLDAASTTATTITTHARGLDVLLLADVRSDWNDPTTYRPALEGADRVYLMTPVIGQAGRPIRSATSLTKRQPPACST